MSPSRYSFRSPLSGGNEMIASEFDVVVVGPAMPAFAPR
jgi:hypothetical protein